MQLGIFFALAGGATESLVLAFRRWVEHGFTWTGDAWAWAPLAYVLIYVPAILAAALLAPRLRPAWVIGFFASINGFALSFLVFHRHLLTVAQLCLAAGAGVMVARWWMGRGALVPRLVPRAIALLLVFALLAPPVLLGSRAVRERMQSASLPAARTDAPNVLLLILDTVRASSLGLYGNPRSVSPAIDALARRGVVFESAWSPAPWTFPAHASFFTGAWPWQLVTNGNLLAMANWAHVRPLGPARLTLAEAFGGAGYRTAGFAGNVLYVSRESGLDRGFQHFDEYQVSMRQLLLGSALGQYVEEMRTGVRSPRRPNDRKGAAVVDAALLSWLAANRDRPWFVFANYFDAHLPYEPAPADLRRFASGRPRLDAYEASIAGLDAEIGRLVDTLGRIETGRPTIVVLAADHGESVGEHGLEEHSFGLYVQDLRVPLVVWGSGIPAGVRVHAVVSTRDLAETVARLAGLGVRFPGTSLARLWSPDSAAARVSEARSEVETYPGAPAGTPIAGGSLRSVTSGNMHYIRRTDGHEELYDVLRDPAESDDLARQVAMAGTLASLRARLAAHD